MDVNTWTPSFWSDNEADCLQLLKANYHKIPLLNVNDTQNLQHNTLVRFRGMVQDMYNPEYYLEKYEVTNEASNETVLKNGKYVDAADCNDNEIVDHQSRNNVTGERHTYVAISVPGLNDWVESIDLKNHKITPVAVHSSRTQEKRPLETNGEMETDTVGERLESKKHCADHVVPNVAAIISDDHMLNFPLPNRKGKACHLKVYGDSESIKLNEVFDFVGFLSVDPQLAVVYDDGDAEMEMQTHNPPPSLIPRIHCVAWEKLEHVNPLVVERDVCAERIKFLKKELHIVLTQLLLGDELAAEYLLYHLISGVYLRKDLMALGKFSLNVSNVPVSALPNYGEKLYEFVELLVTKSHYLPMTLENMNEISFVPKKDYECDRLSSGLLQLSGSTHLVLDETKLLAGKLDASGVRAVAAISELIKNQKLPYDFNYYRMEFDCDVPVLICSEGKSLLPSDCHVVLTPDEVCVATFNEILEAARRFLKPDLLNGLRAYLTLSRLRKYEIGEDMLELVQDEFVGLRRRENATADDLHGLLVLARLVCLAEGKSTLDRDAWRRACELETLRKRRLLK